LSRLARRVRRNLAVSTVIGTVLMAVLTITIGTAVVIWASQTFGLYQGSAGIYYSNRAAALRESIVIEDVWYYNAASANCGNPGTGTYNCINITVRNTGTIEAKIAAIYINGTSKVPASLSLPYTINVNSAKTFMIQYKTGGWGTQTKAYYVQVASARGNQVSIYWGYP